MLTDTIQQLKQRKLAIRTEIAQLNAEDRQIERAIKAIRALPVPASAAAQPVKKRKMSAAGRRAIAAGAKARWAKHNAAKKAAATLPKKRKMSAATKAKLAAAQKARWAKIKAANAKK